MQNNKPIIFVSHAAVDSGIAGVFKSDVEQNFLGLCSLFVSSDLDSIQGGFEWIQRIKENLSNAVISIGLYSPVALTRPWIYTEFGAGWIRDIPTITLCHSGLQKNQLPVPLSHFQALDLTDELHLKHLYEQITEAINCQLPNIDFSAEVNKYREITETQRVQRMIHGWFTQLKNWNPDLDSLFDDKEVIEILIPAQADADFLNFKQDVEQSEFLIVEQAGMAMGTRVGAQASVWNLRRGVKFDVLKSLLNI
ncbi:hypothetical protein LRP52_02400 [Photobacterium sp. ZSDE20]|uniref:TIR domain-containing protein n=1 Tax=Photobacterium pectinilyticum TaxID=2906793 RepID=A0ABT1MZK2_9GAMM|nr:hypothetical protein [Photobacterium sp. ZSDE20]MCQ1056921.1 hypothetical protein [Photobacterium sp. ZSDE20]MDD1821056.1 hypothetical protein [Photobacterium sp. ZSDE20]